MSKTKKGEVLIIKRVKTQEGQDGSVLTWAFPGGKQKYQESRSECVIRETLAETGYNISYLKEISMRVPKQFPIILVYHLCNLVDPKPVHQPEQPWEVSEVKWVKPGELKDYFTTDLEPKVAQELGIGE